MWWILKAQRDFQFLELFLVEIKKEILFTRSAYDFTVFFSLKEGEKIEIVVLKCIPRVVLELTLDR